MTQKDFADWTITDQSRSKQSGVTHVYIRQQYKGIPLMNGVANFAIKDGQVNLTGNRLVSNLSSLIRNSNPVLKPSEAITAAAILLNIEVPKNLSGIKSVRVSSSSDVVFVPKVVI